ncbi:MAG: hypothetical protein Q7T86_16635 [Hyphomicrobiaceae bacterium]|nr:hypothetical protein [Hyphomicrobiaceae bacterium]
MFEQADKADFPLNFHWELAAVDDLKRLAVPIPKNAKQIRSLLCVVTAVLLADRCGLRVSYSRQANFYTGATHYGLPGFTLTHVRNAVAALLAASLIEEERCPPNKRGWRSQIWATPALQLGFGGISGFRYNPVELVRLKDCNGSLIRYLDTDETIRMRTEIATLNDAWGQLNIGYEYVDETDDHTNLTGDVAWIDGRAVFPAKVAGYRVFNEAWGYGGRLYGPFWQQMKKQHRSRLTLNGEAVAEPDFRHIHPLLLYGRLGLDLTGDAYEVEGVNRSIAKRAWNIMINARGEPAATRAVADKLKVEGVYRDFEGKERFREARRILRQVEKRHTAISSEFYTGVGLQLQKLDAEMMLAVLGDCLADGFMSLPVHDSFVVQSTKEDRVREFMDARLSELMAKLKS